MFVDDFLTHVRLRALTFVMGAVVVDVLALLDFAYHRTPAVAALHQMTESELVGTASRLPPPPVAQGPLNTIPKLLRDQRRVRPLVELAPEPELAVVDRVREYPVQEGNELLPLTVGEMAFAPHQVAQLRQRILARGVLLEEPPKDLGLDRIRFDVAFAVSAGRGPVPERDAPRGLALIRLLLQTLLDLLAEVVDVLLGHQHFDAVHELVRGVGLGRDDGPFLDEVDFQIQVIERQVVLEVAVEAVRLLDQHDAAVVGNPFLALVAEELDHPLEVAATGFLCGLGVDELVDHL